MTPLLSAPTQSSVHVASSSITSLGIVPFSRRRSYRKRQNLRAPAPSPPEQPRLPHGNSTSGSLLQDRRAATCTSENGATSAMPVNEPTYAKLAGGTTPRAIAQALPEIKSPFNPQMWRSGLRTHPDTDFVNDLLHDIEFGVRIGYQPVTRDYQIYATHFSAILNPEPVAREIERELDLNRKVGPFLIPPFENFTGSPVSTGNYRATFAFSRFYSPVQS